MAELPSGTVTFLLTDVEGSTALWEQAPEAMRAALARHDALFEQADSEVDPAPGYEIEQPATGWIVSSLSLVASSLPPFCDGPGTPAAQHPAKPGARRWIVGAVRIRTAELFAMLLGRGMAVW